jgi:mono/diheme cytochrome c family protein
MLLSKSLRHDFLKWSSIICVLSIIIAGCFMSKSDNSPGSDPAPGSKAVKSDPDTISTGGAERGKALFDSIGCMGCHMVNGEGGRVGPDLSDEANKGRSRKWYTIQIRNPRENDPQSIMPAYNNLSDQKVNDLIDYLMTLSTKKDSKQEHTSAGMQVSMNRDGSSQSAVVSLSQAGQTWAEVCGRCHNLRPPSEYSDAQWVVVLDHMRVRAPLTGEEQKQVLEFLKANN